MKKKARRFNSTTKNKDKTLLDYALEYHSKGIKVVKAHYKGKFPPKGGEWKKYRTEPITKRLLMKWFGTKSAYCNISMITGTASGGLTVLDFDDLDAYHWWADKYPDLADKLPTSMSGRGCHVFFRSELDKDDTSSFDKIDIKANGLSSLPPSMHKSSYRYKWIIPLPQKLEELPLLNPYDWNLNEYQDGNDGNKGLRRKRREKKVCKKMKKKNMKKLKDSTKDMIEEAIEYTLPTEYGQRHNLLFLFARKLKGIDEIKDCSADELMHLADKWHERALPNIQTKSPFITQERFADAWKDAKYPPGKGITLDIARDAAFNSTEPMAELDNFQGDRFMEKVIRLCFELQRLAGIDNEWFLPTDKAKELFGVSHRTLAIALNGLDGEIIQKTKKHTAYRCSRYKYIGQSIENLKIKSAIKKRLKK